MNHLNYNKLEIMLDVASKFAKTLIIIVTRPQKLLAMIRSQEYSRICKPLPFFIFSICLFIFSTQLTPLTKSFAPHYAPWNFSQEPDTVLFLMPELLFIILNIALSLVIIGLTAMLVSRTHWRPTIHLLLYFSAMVYFLKLFFMVFYPITLNIILKDGLKSSLSITPAMYLLFDIGLYLLTAILLIIPGLVKSPTKNNHNEFIPFFNNIPSRRIAGLASIVFLYCILAFSNFVGDKTNKRIFSYKKNQIRNINKDLSIISPDGSEEGLPLTATYTKDDSVSVSANSVLYSNLTMTLIPRTTTNNFYFSINEVKTRSWSLIVPYLKMTILDARLQNNFDALDAGKLYNIHLGGKMSKAQFEKFKTRFDNKEAEISFDVFSSKTHACKSIMLKRIIKITANSLI